MNFKTIALLSFFVVLQFLHATNAQGQNVDRSQWKCGNGTECPAGSCCSVWGWCGKSETHCTVECKSQCKNNSGLVPDSATATGSINGEQTGSVGDNSQSDQKTTAPTGNPTGASGMNTNMASPTSASNSEDARSAQTPSGSAGSQSAKATNASTSGMKTGNNVPTSTLPLTPGGTSKPGSTPGSPATAATSNATRFLNNPFFSQIFIVCVTVCLAASRNIL